MTDPSGSRARMLSLGGRIVRSIWFFPAILAATVILLTALQISGSSLGIYHSVLHGGQLDPDTVFNNPQGIRSDEWSVNTQVTIAQDAADYPRINPNIGNGQDVSLIVDAPYKEWSAVFKPHNLAFLVLPFDYAFAFKWWVMGFLLIVSCYFFVLALMPQQRWLAAGVSLTLFFTPFVQWWYQYGTLGPIYYALFAATVFILLLRSRRLLHAIGWGVLLAYLLVCFALVLYPPFQIACALAVAAFAVGYLIEQGGVLGRRLLLRQVGVVVVALAVAGAVIGAFVATRMSVIETIQNTAYPGQRVQPSGGFAMIHLFSGNTSLEMQSGAKAALYQIPASGLTNQSESSNFLLVFPFLLLPGLVLLFQSYRAKRRIDWPLLLVCLAFLGALAWLALPHLDLVGKVLFLKLVPHTRLLIGVGLLNVIGLILVARRLQDEPALRPGRTVIIGYSVVVLVLQVLISLHVLRAFPGYLHTLGFLFSLAPVPLVVYLVLRRHFTGAAAVLLAFSVATTAFIHPLQRGTDALTRTPLSETIRALHVENPNAGWAVEAGSVLSFPFMNGARSISGVQAYPQLDLWRAADEQRGEDFVYNRYAQVKVVFDRDAAAQAPTTFKLVTSDHFEVHTEPCGAFLRQQNVTYLLADAPINEPCLTLRETVRYPAASFLIYQVR
ncbi:hypothetical protein AB0A95_20160 [Micromonospora sp. NPDC049230]|uniref:DUF7657 domain-containing protein n=1 Tax=Micromonospora sp. NPDC049230 TaxID=3155502 RepID=UPI0033C86F73